jgi:membrane protein YqaA with SNARE-associated domain
MPDLGSFTVPIEPFAGLAAAPLIVAVLVAWGVGEALVLPVVPDVLLGLLVLAAPWQLGPLLGAAVVGGVVGALADWWLLLNRRSLADRILMLQPGLGRPGLAEAEARVRRRGPCAAFAQVGPGLPLKAWLHALSVVAPATTRTEVAALALVNRVARLGPVALALALVHPLALGWQPATLTIAWIAGWSAFYAGYWIVRDPRRRG